MSGPRIADRVLDRMRSHLETPDVIAERYELRGLLGRGGMGEVHLGFDRRLRRDVAVKLLPADASASHLAARLEQEARVLARLEHPGIVPVYDAGALDDGRVFYVMRYLKGMSLDAYARSGVSRGEMLRSLLRIAEAVGYAHERGVIHRDLKPGNVLIGAHGDRLVLDWGVAKLIEAEGREPAAPLPTERDPSGGGAPLTGDGIAIGTPGYMAPEQAAGGSVDARADVHALGVMMRELLADLGEPPGKSLAAIVEMATAGAPESRYASVGAFADDLRRWLDGEAVAAHREGPLERLGRFARRHQVAILLLLAYVLVRSIILFMRGI